MATKFYDLQQFADEGVTASDAGMQSVGEVANEGTGTIPEVSTNEQTATADVESFDSLIKGRYKDDFNKAVQGIVQRRLSKSKADTDFVNKLEPVIQLLGRNYGMDIEDIRKADLDALSQHVMDDNRFYEELASQMGLSEDQAKRVYKTEQRNRQLEAQERERTAEDERRQAFSNIIQQADVLKQQYPGFDLDTEMSNPEFLKMVMPYNQGGLGIPVETAYFALHKDELQKGAMQYAVQRTAEQITDSIRSGAQRPKEAGLNSNAGNGSLTVNPRNLSAAQREEIRRRVARGEKISF